MRALQRRIIPMKRVADYLKARKLTRDKGGLPSHVLHDDCLMRDERRPIDLILHLYAAWARELLIYPEKDGCFSKGKDIVDSSEDGKGRRWVLPASYVPAEAIGRRKVGLFVDPKDIIEERGRVVVYPASIAVLYPFLQKTGFGEVDERTRIPLEPPPGLRYEYLPYGQVRHLSRVLGVGIRPLFRTAIDKACGVEPFIFASENPSIMKGVAYAESEAPIALAWAMQPRPEESGVMQTFIQTLRSGYDSLFS